MPPLLFILWISPKRMCMTSLSTILINFSLLREHFSEFSDEPILVKVYHLSFLSYHVSKNKNKNLKTI